jgi:hypothetical protein
MSGRGRAAGARSTPSQNHRQQVNHPHQQADRQQMTNQQHRPSAIMTADEFMKYALSFVGFESRQDVAKKENLRRFRAFFGIGPQAACKVYCDLIDTSDIELKHFCLTLNWLKSYDTELILSGWWKIHEQSVRQWVWSISRSIQQLKDKKVCFFQLFDDLTFPYSFLFFRLCLANSSMTLFFSFQ